MADPGDSPGFLDQPGFADAVRAVMTDLLALPPSLMDYFVQYNALNGLPIPVSQLTGFTQFTAQGAVVETQESTTSTSFTDLATVGPEVTELTDGHYVMFWGSSCFTSDATKQAIMGISLNGVNQSPFTEAQGGNAISVARGALITMTNNDNNTLKCVYVSGANTSTAFFRHRWLVAIKFGNL